MADIGPFRAIRPKKGYESRIAALPYDVFDREEAEREVKREPLSFLAIDRAETQFGATVGIYDDCVYEKAGSLLAERIKQGYFVQEEEPSFYLYELTRQGRSQTGFAACASTKDYRTHVIREHENTREDKEQDRVRHVESCNAQTGPVFLAYRKHAGLGLLMEKNKQKEPLYDFCSEDGIRHRVWMVDHEDERQIREVFRQMDAVYIADGHHRCASAVKVAGKQGRENAGILSVWFPEDQLTVMDYNRVVRDLNGLSKETFLEKAAASFTITQKGSTAFSPERKGCFGLYLDGEWYRLEIHPGLIPQDPVGRLDVSLLQEYLLGPVLGIEDPRTSPRLDFVGGIRGLKELERRVQGDCKAAFSMFPTSLEELFAVADAGLLMPPKSTWFEPKLRSGLFIHSLADEPIFDKR